jgi:hypothetical protein
MAEPADECGIINLSSDDALAALQISCRSRARSRQGLSGGVYTVSPDNAESEEERAVIHLFNASPDVRAFARDWILYCYHCYEAASDAMQPRQSARASR